jgi:hypothetical protein
MIQLRSSGVMTWAVAVLMGCILAAGWQRF